MKRNKEKYINYAIIIAIAVALSIKFFGESLLDTNDGKLHLLRILGVIDSMKAGIFPPIISPNYCNTWGYAINLFYNPLTTYGPMLLRSFVNSYTVAIKLFMGLSIVIAGICMHRFTYEVTKNYKMSILSAVMYITVPYYLCDMYTRGAVAEFVALSFIPLVFLGLYNLVESDGSKHYYIGIGATLLLLTHNITTVYTAIFCLIYIAFNYKKIANKEKIKKIFINVFFILTISLFFIVPLIANKAVAEYTIFSDYMSTSAQEVNENGLLIRNLIFGHLETGINAQIGIPIIVGLVLIAFSIKKVDEKYSNIYKDFSVLGIVALLLSLKYFPWICMPKVLTIIQFPWRLVGFAGFFLSFATAVEIVTLLKNKIRTENVLNSIQVSIICLILVCASFEQFAIEDRGEELLDIEYEQMREANMQINCYQVNREYMPLKSFEKLTTYLEKRGNSIEILQGDCDIENEQKENLKITADIKNIEKDTKLEMPFFYYYGYDAYVIDENDNKTKIDICESENGFIEVDFSNEFISKLNNFKIVVKYETPSIYYVAIVISITSFIGFVVYIIYYKRKLKQINNIVKG